MVVALVVTLAVLALVFAFARVSIVSANFEHCSYTGSLFPGNNWVNPPGVQVIDASDPSAPRVVGSLTDPAMRGGTWETLKVNKKRKLLAATSVPLLWGLPQPADPPVSRGRHAV